MDFCEITMLISTLPKSYEIYYALRYSYRVEGTPKGIWFSGRGVVLVSTGTVALSGSKFRANELNSDC